MNFGHITSNVPYVFSPNLSIFSLHISRTISSLPSTSSATNTAATVAIRTTSTATSTTSTVTSTASNATITTHVVTGTTTTTTNENAILFDPVNEDLQLEEDYRNNLGETVSVTSETSNMSSVLSTATKTAKKRKADETTEMLREFLANRPKPSDFIPQTPVDDIQHFLNSIAVTMRRLSPLSIARLKVKIANIVGEEEILWATQNPVEYIYLDQQSTTIEPAQTQSQGNQSVIDDEMDVQL